MRAYACAMLLAIETAAVALPAAAPELIRNRDLRNASGLMANGSSGGMRLKAGIMALSGWTVADGTVL